MILRCASAALATALHQAVDAALGYPKSWRTPSGEPVDGQTDHHMELPNGRDLTLAAVDAPQVQAIAATAGITVEVING